MNSESDLDNIAHEIGEFLRFWGRVDVRQTKEKFGTVRVYCSLGWASLLNITHPGYCHYGPYPKWLQHFDIYHSHLILRPLNYFIFPYHQWLYRLAYKRAIIRYPEYHEAIISCADYSELLNNLLD